MAIIPSTFFRCVVSVVPRQDRKKTNGPVNDKRNVYIYIYVGAAYIYIYVGGARREKREVTARKKLNLQHAAKDTSCI